MIKVIIIGDHSVVRHGLRQIINEESDMKVAAEAESAHEAFRITRKTDCDVVVLDISLPGMSGNNQLCIKE